MACHCSTFVDIAACNTVHSSALWKGPAVWTTKSTPCSASSNTLALRVSTWTNSDRSPSLDAKDSPFSRFLPPTRMLRSGRSLESAVAAEPPTRPVPPSTSTRAVLEDDLFTWAASLVEGAAAGGAHARTMPMVAIRWAYRLGRLLRSDGDVRYGEGHVRCVVVSNSRSGPAAVAPFPSFLPSACSRGAR